MGLKMIFLMNVYNYSACISMKFKISNTLTYKIN